MKNTEYRRNLLVEYIKNTNYINKDADAIIYKIGVQYLHEQQFLFEVYRSLAYDEGEVKDDETGAFFRKEKSRYILGIKDVEESFDKDILKKIIISLLDLLEDTLPLGTVVDIRKDIYRETEEQTGVRIDDLEDFRVVITHRFLGSNGKMYYPYAGVVYPTGMLEGKEVFYFTRPMVEKIVKRGYEDEKDYQFQFLMKNELIINQGMKTAGYSDTSDLIELNKSIRDKHLE